MAGFTRRTHIVRVKQPLSTLSAGQDQPYVDIEVLDAIAYKTTNGETHIWKCPSSAASPYILDTTGDTPNWNKGGPRSTRGSHAQQIAVAGAANPAFDIEVLDRIAFRDDNGKIWCLDCPSVDAQPFCVTDGTGNPNSTRRTHLEEIKPSFTSGGTGGIAGSWSGPNSPGNSAVMTIERTDMVGFTGADEKKLIIKMESHDDGLGLRANTYTTPQGYDPNLKFGGVEVPELIASGDPNFYFKFFYKVVQEPAQPIFGPHGFFIRPIFNNYFDTPAFGMGPYNTFGDAVAALEAEYGVNGASNTVIITHTDGGYTYAINFGGLLSGGDSSEFFATEAEAIGAAANQVGLDGETLSYTFTTSFIAPPGPIIGTLPAHTVTQVGNLATGGIQSDPTQTIKISMGPLWWIRAVYLGGGTPGDENP